MSGEYKSSKCQAETRFVALDLLRGLAAIVILVYHSYPFFGKVAPGGYLAVDLFFALSGFVIAHSYEGKLTSTLSWRAFMLKRIIRFYPLYLLGLVLGVILAMTLLVVGATSALPFEQITVLTITGLLFLPSLYGGDIYPLNVPAWSLAYELIVNGLYAAVVRWLTNARLYAIAIVSFCGFAALSLFTGETEGGPLLHQIPEAFMRAVFSFTVGLIIYRKRIIDNDRNPILFIAIAIALLFIPLPQDWRVPYNLMCVGAVFPVLLWLIASTQVNSHDGIMILLGSISYPLYAIHWPLIWITFGSTQVSSAPLLPTGVVMIIAIFVGSFLLSRYYDEPLRRWLSASLRGATRKSEAAE